MRALAALVLVLVWVCVPVLAAAAAGSPSGAGDWPAFGERVRACACTGAAHAGDRGGNGGGRPRYMHAGPLPGH